MIMSSKRHASLLYFFPPPPPKRLELSTCIREEDHPADFGNLNLVARIMKTALPDNAKIAKEAKECMQECVSEFISFITSEGKLCVSDYASSCLSSSTYADLSLAAEKCQHEKRKTVNGEDILFAMTSLGFENYGEALKIYLSRYRDVCIYLLLSLVCKEYVLTSLIVTNSFNETRRSIYTTHQHYSSTKTVTRRSTKLNVL